MKHARLLAWSLGSIVLLSGCNTVKQVPIESEPAGAQVYVQEGAIQNQIGVTPLTHGFDLPDDTTTYKVVARMEGYVDSRVNLSNILLEAKGGKLRMVLEEDKAWQGTIPSPLANAKVPVEANPRLDENEAWKRLVNTITIRFNYKLAPGTEQKSGYLLTEPRVEGFTQGPDTARVTNIVTANLTSTEPVIYTVQVESKIDVRGETRRYDRILRNGELKLLEELQASLTAE